MIPFTVYLFIAALMTWAIIAYLNKFHIPRLYKIAREDTSGNTKLLKQFYLALGSLLFLALTVVLLAFLFMKLNLKVPLYWLIAPHAVTLLYAFIFKSRQIVEVKEILYGEKK